MTTADSGVCSCSNVWQSNQVVSQSWAVVACPSYTLQMMTLAEQLSN